MTKLSGQCLCGDVKFSADGDIMMQGFLSEMRLANVHWQPSSRQYARYSGGYA